MELRAVLEKDAIPSIDDPAFGEAYIGDGEDRVLVVDGDPARAYPFRILDFHEVVNDTVDGEALAVTWCPLCASAVVYERTVAERTLTFGVSGKLADDDLVMYDRETDSEWKQSRGACIAGPLEGRQLTARPGRVFTWREFVEAYPDGVVLQPPGGPSEAASDTDEPAAVGYDEEPYREYFQSDGFGLDAHRGGESREWNREDIDPKTVVLGIERGDQAVGYPASRVREAGRVVTDEIGETRVVVFAAGELQAFENPGYEFERVDGRFRADGTVWHPVTGESEDGRQLDPVPARRLFAFTWQDDHGSEGFYR